MKIYMPLWKDNPHDLGNPYVYTLVDSITKLKPSFDFTYDKELFWKKSAEDFDIIHFMWPDVYFNDLKIKQFESRLLYLKQMGVRIIATCHNEKSHKESNYNFLYDFIYKNSDVIIHLGVYSKEKFDKIYNNKNIIIPHHIYDEIYDVNISKERAREKLGLPPHGKYILCFGAFRNNKERKMVKDVAKDLKQKNISILAPSFFVSPGRKKPVKYFVFLIKKIFNRVLYPTIRVSGHIVPDRLLPLYFSAADVVLIQRVNILNSGNVPMAFLYGRPVVGPNIGNVGDLLTKTGNVVFDRFNYKSLFDALLRGMQLSLTKLGENNRTYAMNKFSSHIIAKDVIKEYESLLSH